MFPVWTVANTISARSLPTAVLNFGWELKERPDRVSHGWTLDIKNEKVILYQIARFREQASYVLNLGCSGSLVPSSRGRRVGDSAVDLSSGLLPQQFTVK